jgi:hypothetical protein
MDGKYVGNRPIKLSKVKDEVYGSINTVTVSGRKVSQPVGVRRQAPAVRHQASRRQAFSG